MATCPNKNHPIWNSLVESQGESMSYYLWNRYEGNVEAIETHLEGKLQAESLYYDPPGGEKTTVDTSPFRGLIDFKRQSLENAYRTLNTIKAEKEASKSDVNKLKEIIQREKQVRDSIFGTPTTVGLRKEIDTLLKTSEVDSVESYVERDLSRLEVLSQSNYPEDIEQAKRIISFYKDMGTFDNPERIHPIFGEDLYFEDGILRKEESVLEPYRQWRAIAEGYTARIEARNSEHFVKTVNSQEGVQKLKPGGYSEAELLYRKEGLKDASFVDMMIMDISSGIFSHNGIVPQAMLQVYQDSWNTKVSWSKDINSNIDKLLPTISKEMEKLGYGMSRLGMKGINWNALFRQKTAEGFQTKELVHRYSHAYFREKELVFSRYHEKMEKAEDHSNKVIRNSMEAAALKELREWQNHNSILLDLNKIPELLDGNSITQEAEDYKKELISLLGEKGYEEQISEQKEQIEKYNIERQALLETLLGLEGVTEEENLSSDRKAELTYWDKQNNPYVGVTDYYTPTRNRIGGIRVPSKLSFNVSIPRKIALNGKETGFYDSDYAKIEANENLKEFYDLVNKVTKQIKLWMPYELQSAFTANTLAGLRKSVLEIFMDKDLPFFVALSQAAREIYDRIKQGFGILRESVQSYDVLDMVTGKVESQVSTQFISQNARAIKQIVDIERIKFGRVQPIVNERGKPVSVNRYTVLSLNTMSPESIAMIANYLDVPVTSLKEKFGENIPVGRIIQDYATHNVVSSNSYDLPKVIKYFSHLAAEYAARKETLPILSIMKDKYQSIKAPKTNAWGQSLEIVDDDKEENREVQFQGIRKRANEQLEDWFNRVILGDYETKHIGVIESFHRVVGTSTKDKAKRVAEIATGKSIGIRITSKKEKQLINELNTLISQTSEIKELNRLNEIKDQIGKHFSATAAFDNLLSFLRLKGLGWNLPSAFNNFFEGTTSNMILAAEGEYFDPELIYKAYGVVYGNFAKTFSLSLADFKGSKKNRILMERYRVLQDSTNELQKASIKSNFSKLNSLNPYDINRKVEFVNQSPLMVAMLMHQKIKGADGKESSVWDALDENGKLSENYSSQENRDNWEKATGKEFLEFYKKLSSAITKGHGNYDVKRGMMAKSSTIGKALLMFKTWVSSQFYQRFAVQQDDLAGGIKDFKGRYWSLSKGSGAAYGSIIGAVAMGPVGAPIGGAIGGLLAGKYGSNTGANLLKELGYTYLQLAKKMVGMPINLLAGREIITSKGSFEQYLGNNFTERDVKNMRANMADISAALMWITLTLLAKGFFWDDDDEKDSPRRWWHNVLTNNFMRLTEQSFSFLDPSTYKKMVGDMVVIKFGTDIIKLGREFGDYLEGDDLQASGPNAGKSSLWSQTKKTFFPGVVSSFSSLGFGTQGERQFSPSEFDEYFWSEEKVEHRKNKAARAERRQELEDEGYTDKQINRILKSELPTESQKNPAKSRAKTKLKRRLEEQKRKERAEENKEDLW